MELGQFQQKICRFSLFNFQEQSFIFVFFIDIRVKLPDITFSIMKGN